MEKEYLVQDDTEHRVKVREWTEEDDLLLIKLAEEYGDDYEEGTDLREKQLQWRKEHGISLQKTPEINTKENINR